MISLLNDFQVLRNSFQLEKKLLKFFSKKIVFHRGTLTELLKNDDFVEKNRRNSPNNFFLVQKRLENTQRPSLGCQEPILMFAFIRPEFLLTFSKIRNKPQNTTSLPFFFLVSIFFKTLSKKYDELDKRRTTLLNALYFRKLSK